MKKLITASIALLSIFLFMFSPLFAEEIYLSAASSLKEVINELSVNFIEKNKNTVLKKNYGGSGAMAKQIENGAPADIFISANTGWIDYIKAKKYSDEKSITAFAYNTLVFSGKPGSKITTLNDIINLDKIAIGSPKSVPAGQYAVEALKKAGLFGKVEKKLVMAKDVRECLMYAERGEVDGAFVYRTDALQNVKFAEILFTVPQAYYSRVTYPMALTLSGAKKTEAVSFFKFLKSAEAKAVLKKYGFIVN